jgi:hypothetical protein
MQMRAATMALLLPAGILGFQPQPGWRQTAPFKMPSLMPPGDPVQFKKRSRSLNIQCRITPGEVDQLVRHALLNSPLPERDDIWRRVKTPADIYQSGVVSARWLVKLNRHASAEEVRRNNLKALFLRDKLGQCVVNETLKTWEDKFYCLVGIIAALPQEWMQFPGRQAGESRKVGLSQLSQEEARQLAQSFMLKKPLKNRDVLLAKIETFNDMAQVDREACRLLDKMNEGKPEGQARRNTLKYLFLMHHVGVHMTRQMVQSPEEKRMYRQHLLEVLKPW